MYDCDTFHILQSYRICIRKIMNLYKCKDIVLYVLSHKHKQKFGLHTEISYKVSAYIHPCTMNERLDVGKQMENKVRFTNEQEKVCCKNNSSWVHSERQHTASLLCYNKINFPQHTHSCFAKGHPLEHLIFCLQLLFNTVRSRWFCLKDTFRYTIFHWKMSAVVTFSLQFCAFWCEMYKLYLGCRRNV